ncbi:MAG: M48 family metalloprotease [Halorhodospira sp.]
MPHLLARYAITLLAGAALLCAAPPAAIGSADLPQLGLPGSDALPLHEERELGHQVMQQVRAQMPLLEDAEVTEYISDLGHRLAGHTERPDYGFHFFVIEDERINAFALPGGHIGVHTGLIRETRSESELAGVVAHELGHVTQRHIARRYAQAKQLNLQTAAAILAAILVGSQNPQAGSAAAMAGVAAPLQQQLAHSRTHEREADRIGVNTLAVAGFDPAGMPAFFERLADASRYAERPPEYLSTHPLTEHRISEAQGIADRLEAREVYESGHHPFIRARLQVLAHEERSTSATAVMRDELQRSSDDPTARAAALYGLALALSREQGQHAQALALLDTLRAIDGERLYVLLGRAEILRTAGRTQQALAVYQEARSLYPASGAATYRHAETLLATGEPEEARRELARATRNEKPSPLLLRLLAEAAHASEREAEGYIALARYHHTRGDVDLAIAQLNNAIRHAGENSYQRARADALKERWEEQRSRN